MKKYHSIILLLSSIVVFGCSLNEHKTEKPKGEKIVVQNKQKKEEKKPEVSSSKPKKSKPLSELEPISEDEKYNEIRIVPNRFPLKDLLEEAKKKKETDEDKGKGKGAEDNDG